MRLAQAITRIRRKTQDAVFVALRDRNGRVLLVRGPRSYGLVWQFVGGKVETTDVNPTAAIVREVTEETGVRLHPSDLRLLGTAPFEFGGGTAYFFEALLAENAKISCPQAEITESRWFYIADARRVRSWPSTRESLDLLS
jgi:8-oxo-dGTP pyrophosphatase MutT (NUDIX family)